MGTSEPFSLLQMQQKHLTHQHADGSILYIMTHSCSLGCALHRQGLAPACRKDSTAKILHWIAAQHNLVQLSMSHLANLDASCGPPHNGRVNSASHDLVLSGWCFTLHKLQQDPLSGCILGRFGDGLCPGHSQNPDDNSVPCSQSRQSSWQRGIITPPLFRTLRMVDLYPQPFTHIQCGFGVVGDPGTWGERSTRCITRGRERSKRSMHQHTGGCTCMPCSGPLLACALRSDLRNLPISCLSPFTAATEQTARCLSKCSQLTEGPLHCGNMFAVHRPCDFYLLVQNDWSSGDEPWTI